MWLIYSLKLIFKPLVILAYLAWVGQLRVGKFAGQWRAYLRRPYHLLGALIAWVLIEWAIKHFT